VFQLWADAWGILVSRRVRCLLTSIAAVGAVCSPLSAQTAQQPPTSRIRSTVYLVQIDVVAKDKSGNPVSGLEANDFTLLDDGQEQKITRLTVEHETLQALPATLVSPLPGASAAAQPNTIFSNTHPENAVPTVILFDGLNTAAEDQTSMKKALLQSLHQLKDGTPVALLVLGEDLTVVNDFTTSTISLRNAAGSGFDAHAEGFGPAIQVRSTGDARIDAGFLKAAGQGFRAEGQDRVAHTLTALNTICNRLAHFRGRKSLVWISGGVDTSSDSRDLADAIDRLNDANVAVYTVDARGVLLDPGIGAENDPNDLAAELHEHREEVRSDVLATVAHSTGGVYYHNTNRLGAAINRALDDRSLVYVLDYYPRHGDWNGKLHKLEVKTSHPGVRLRYRASYRAALPPPATPQEQQQMVAALSSSSLDFPGIRFSVELMPGQAVDPHFVLHVPVEEVQWSSEDGKVAATFQVWFIQKPAAGADIAIFAGKSEVHLPPDAYQAALSHGVLLAMDIKIQPPATKVRVLLRDMNSGRMGSVDVPVDSKPIPTPAN